jgi:hypothetical protein
MQIPSASPVTAARGLAGTTEPKRVVFGRHYGILVSQDGTRVVRSEPLSKSALVMPLKPADEGRGFTAVMLVAQRAGGCS